jgi:putative oxidoreductase
MKRTDLGLLVLRVGVGGMYAAVHGWPKLAGGTERWKKLGGALELFGITSLPTFWGFCAMAAEFGGGILLVLGLFTRPAAAAILVTMCVATTRHLHRGDGFGGASEAIELGIVMGALLLLGPGRYSLDSRLRGRA